MAPITSERTGGHGRGRDASTARKRRVPRKMNPARLERIALAHLQRFGSSKANLRQVLRRRITKSCDHHEQDPAEFEAPLEEVLTNLERLGYLDDRRYGALLVRRARARGTSRRELQAKLRQKGLTYEVVESLLSEEAGGEASEFEAAWRYARRRRLGPYRLDPDDRQERRQRDLAALGRRGFGYGTALTVVDADPDDEPHLG